MSGLQGLVISPDVPSSSLAADLHAAKQRAYPHFHTNALSPSRVSQESKDRLPRGAAAIRGS